MTQAACEDAGGAHISAAAGATTAFTMELDETLTTWTQNIDLNGLFTSTVSNCFLTYNVEAADGTTLPTGHSIVVDDVNSRFAMTFADASAGDKRSPGVYSLKVTAKSTGGNVWAAKT